MNVLQFAGRYQCLPIRSSGRLISLHNEHSIRRDSKVLSGFAWPTVFKPETTPLDILRARIGAHVEIRITLSYSLSIC
jgi:hypothetical protein